MWDAGESVTGQFYVIETLEIIDTRILWSIVQTANVNKRHCKRLSET